MPPTQCVDATLQNGTAFATALESGTAAL